ncbi:MAG: lipopolysaccharide biosynthesis protein [Oscillospiraceae bacterium]|nr:lipopolysaccharide biosynthesis protein [Oscillospiraceae bacterium]
MSDKALKRNLLVNTVGNLIYFACQWLVTGLLIKRLSFAGTGDYNAGLLATAMTVTNIFLTLASYGMRTFQVSDTKDKYSRAAYLESRAVTVGAAVLLCALYSVLAGYRGAQLLCIFLWLAYKLLEAATDVLHGFAQKAERMDVVGISYAARGVVSLAVFCAVFALTQSLPLTLALMAAACWAFCLAYDLPATKTYFVPLERAPLSAVGALLGECAPLALYAFFNTAAASAPKLFLERMLGTETIGVYNLVNSPVLILQVGVVYLFAPFVTFFSARLDSGDRAGFLKLARNVTLLVFAVGVLGIGGVLALGEWGLTWLYGADIAAYKGLLAPMVVCTVFTALSLFYCMLLTVLRDMKGLIGSTLLGIVTALAVSWPLIHLFGMFGTTFACILALAVECAALVFFGLRDLKAPGGTQDRLSDPPTE